MITRFANAIPDREGSEPTDRPAAYLSHIRNGRKQVGHDLARRIEVGMRALGHEFDDVVDGWMDNDHSRVTATSAAVEDLFHGIEACYAASPIETQRALNELARRILLERVTKS
jgi:hypothetical protein